MPVDVRKLDEFLQATDAERTASGSSAARRASGAFAAVRENLAELERLNETYAWSEIAFGLAQQGVLKRDGTPLSGKALTALIASVRRQAKTRTQRSGKRQPRSDLAKNEPPGRAAVATPDTFTSPRTAAGDGATSRGRTAEEIRRAEYERSQRFIKSDNR